MQLRALQGEAPYTDKVPTGLVSDEFLSNDQHNRRPGIGGSIKRGVVVYALPYLHCYRVQVDKLQPDVMCCALTASALTPMSPKVSSVLTPGTQVLVYNDGASHFGCIIGVIPPIVTPDLPCFPDFGETGGGSGFREMYYSGLLGKCANNAEQNDWSNGRPLDATLGEFSVVNDLGMGLSLDNFMAYLRADETAGLWMYYLDHFVRLAAYNFNLETAGSELNARNDQGEFQHNQGFTPYPWEALGLFDKDGDTVSREESDDAVQYDKHVGKHEPAEDDQQPFWRYEEFRGYLGQAYMSHVAAPPKSHGNVYRYSADDAPIGLFRQTIGLDGSFGVESAHSIAIAKRALIVIPKRKKLWEDQKDGDGAEGAEEPYKFASVNGDGDEHKVTGAPKAEGDLPGLRTAAGVHEMCAYMFNWKALHPFHYHKGDYKTPEQTAGDTLKRLQESISFADLKEKQWLDPTEPKQIEIDHRYGEVDYYETTAGLFITPDGSVILRDGYGSEIRMSGGAIVESAAGDLYRLAGRSCVDWSGDDHVIKANNSVDITSSNKDLRLKAKQNLEMLAGNGGKGRLLLENKAESVEHDYDGKVGEDITDGSGIIFKAASCQVVAMAKDIYLRTGSEGGKVQPGNIVLDADKGEGQIYTSCRDFNRKLTGVARDTFFDGDTPSKANLFSSQLTTIDSQLFVNGSLSVTESGIVCNGPVTVVGGHISTEQAESRQGKVDPLKGQGLESANSHLSSVATAVSKEHTRGQSAYTQTLDQPYYQEGKIGSDTVQEKCAFSLRNEEQYGTTEFKLPEPYWQYLVNAGGSEDPGETWEEDVVEYQDQELMPYPGKERWEAEDSFLRVKDKLVEEGKDADRADNEDYTDEPKFDDWETKSLKDNYPVVTPTTE